jgi:WD40 repeat protein
MKQLLVSVHGIRTFGNWQERLERMINAEVSRRNNDQIRVVNYKYGYFSVIAFLIPVLRWLVVRRFRTELLALSGSDQWDRVDLVGHSFGTHIIAWALYSIPDKDRPAIHTLLFAGSVLKSNFLWQPLLGRGVKRVVNDCGVVDSVLLLGQFFVLFTGMAGRIGFNGVTGRNFRNRYFKFGHSDYFFVKGAADDTFMSRYWLPLLTSEAEPELVDVRESSRLSGIYITIINNIEPIKLSVYMTPVIAISAWVYSLYVTADEQRAQAIGKALAAYSDATRPTFPQRSLLLAVEAADIARTRNEPIEPITRHTLLESLRAVGGTPLRVPRLTKNLLLLPSVDTMNGVTLSPVGRWLIGASVGTTRLWDLNSDAPFEPKQSFSGTLLQSAAITPDGSRILTFKRFEQAPVHLWYKNGKGAFDELNLGPMTLDNASFSDDGRWAVTEAYQSYTLWELAVPASPRQIHLGNVKSYRFSHDHSRFAFCTDTEVVTVSLLTDKRADRTIGQCESLAFFADDAKLVSIHRDGKVRVWPVSSAGTSGEPWTIQGDRIPTDLGGTPSFKVWFADGGEWLVTEQYVTSYTNGAQPDWSRITVRRVQRDMVDPLGKILGGGTVQLAFPTPDARWLVTLGLDRSMRLWPFANIDPQAVIVLRSYDSEIYSALVSSDSHWLVSVHSDKSVHLWDLQDKDPGRGSIILRGQDGQSGQMGITPNSRWIASIGNESVRLWPLGSLQAATALPILSSHTNNGEDLEYDIGNLWSMSRSGNWIAAAGRTLKEVSLWHFDKDGEMVEHQVIAAPGGRISAIRIHDDGSFLAVGDERGDAYVWRLGDGTIGVVPNCRYKSGSSPVRQFAFDGKDSTIFIRTTDGIIGVDLGKSGATTKGLPSQELDLPDSVATIFLEQSPDGRWLAANGGTKVRIWDLKAGPSVGSYRDFTMRANSLSFSPDSRLLLADNIEKTMLISLDASFKTSEPQFLPRNNGNGTFYNIYSPPSFSSDGKVVAIIAPGPQNKLNIFEIQPYEPVIKVDKPYAQFSVDDGHIIAYALSVDGRMVIICDDRPLCQLWERHGDTYESMPLPSPDTRTVSSVAISSDMRWGITVSAGREGISRWPLTYAEMRTIAARSVGRNLSNEEWKLYFTGQEYRATFSEADGVRD